MSDVFQNVSGNQVNIVRGTQNIGSQTVRTDLAALRRATEDLQAALGSAGLSSAEATQADRDLQEVNAEVQNPQPDPRRVVGTVQRLTQLLNSAGALAGAANSLREPLRVLAAWVGLPL
ncbi:hypothetical protein ACI780_22395 [Geodermatophilus sp. SYSU D00814]